MSAADMYQLVDEINALRRKQALNNARARVQARVGGIPELCPVDDTEAAAVSAHLDAAIAKFLHELEETTSVVMMKAAEVTQHVETYQNHFNNLIAEIERASEVADMVGKARQLGEEAVVAHGKAAKEGLAAVVREHEAGLRERERYMQAGCGI